MSEEKVEVEIRSERIIPIFRGELPETHQIAVTYQPAGVPIPRTVWILVEDIFKERTEEFLKQYAVKEGSLYTEWLTVRANQIRLDIEARKAFKPEKVSV